MSKTDIAIIGGGINGASTALELAKNGLKVTLVPNKNGFGTCLFFSSLVIKREKSILPKGAKNLFENSNPFNEFINIPTGGLA